MVGVLAMAAAAAPPPVKDYEIEPCKKRRKDEDSPSCKTITKYLSPTRKTTDKVFSPPKSSNILHYFRKTSPTSEKVQSAKECKIKSCTSSLSDNSKVCKTPLEVFSNTEFKKTGKRVNLFHQLNYMKAETESPIEISSDDSLNDFVESSTSVVLHKKHMDVLAESIQNRTNQTNPMTSKKNPKKGNPKQGTTRNDCKSLRKRKHKDVIDLSNNSPLAKEVILPKKDGKAGKQTMPSLTHEMERTETAHLNDSTITVSYEEFLKSHNETKVEEVPDPTGSICLSSDTVDMIKSGYTSESENSEIAQQVHLKTVTVLAQVHPTPPKKTRKIPSIFLKQKQLEMENSLSDPENEQTVQKRKSNVVIQEEELELAVLEAGNSEAAKPKCTLEERQQFMKAFRQPVSDALKNGGKKSMDKQKDLSDKSLNEEGDDSKKILENPNIQITLNHSSPQSHTDKGSKKLKKKGKKTLATRATPGENREENTPKKDTACPLKDKPSQNRLRMSLRQKKSEVFKSSTLLNSESLLCEGGASDVPLRVSSFCDKTKSSRKTSTPIKNKAVHCRAELENRLVNASTPKSTRRSIRSSSTPTSASLRGAHSKGAQDTSPVKASTPKASSVLEKHSLYTAELITVSSDSERKMKVAPLFLAKKAQKTANPVLDFDDSSQDKSQDCDVQFKARRDFLMSGLPDSLKRRIAKKAAALDVYNAVSTSFQRVLHVQQQDEGCWLWHLKPPSCPLLTKFKERNTKVTDLSKCFIALGEFSTLNLTPKNSSSVMLIRTRKDFTTEVRNLLLEEIRLSNPDFSLGKYFPLLLKKRIEHQVLSEHHGKKEKPQLEPGVKQRETKRKRVETGNQKSKRKKPNELSVSPEEIKGTLEELNKTNNSSGINPDSSKDSGTEDMLWTEKYQPQNANELIGNELAVKKLHSWLQDWKRRAELEEKQNLKGKRDEKQEGILNLSDSTDFKGSSDDEEESRLCNTVLITGPTGVGKTAAVYACAQELGFKVSSGLDKQGVNSQKPCFFNSYNIGKSPSKYIIFPKIALTPKLSLQPKFNTFNVIHKCKHISCVPIKIKSSLEQKQITLNKSINTNNSNIKEFGAEESNRKNATSLILFEEVDVIFDEDAGFLNAVKTFMATTKRPVILTTSDPTFSLVFDGCFEEINFSIPSLVIGDFHIKFFLPGMVGHIDSRENSRNILTCSEDGSHSKSKAKNAKKKCIELPKCDTGCVETLFGLKNIFPKSEDLFSFLKHKFTTKEEWQKLIQLLIEFHTWNIDFLYSNLEFILPLPVDIIPEVRNVFGSSVTLDASAATGSIKSEEKPLKKSQKKKQKKMVILDDSDLFDTGLDFSDDLISLSPASSSTLEKSTGRDNESNPETKKVNKCSESSTESIHPPKTLAEKKCSLLVSHCLNSLTEFMDNISFLDSLVRNPREQHECGRNDFHWTSGKVKSGLCDEFGVENSDGWTSQSCAELKATAEALSFTKCSYAISKALEALNSCKKLGRDPTNDLTLYVSQKRSNVCFSQSAANLDNAGKRIAVIERVFSSRSFLNLGNKQASIIEYLPTLRNICRTEKLKEEGKNKRRFLHYFEGIHLDIPKETVNTLAAEFP
uniref:ATPase family, AAA domain containing 5 n=1 Tax=Jaculus jaculus TaxID=51337 RepID=A0A8C5KLL3_JACJA